MHDLKLLVRRAPRVLRLPPREIVTTLHAVAVLVVVEISIRFVKLPRLSRLLGVRIDLMPPQPDRPRLSPGELSELARRRLRCTWRVTEAWPFSRGPCLRRALVGGHLIRDLDPAVRLGVTGSGGTLQAHAWLEIDGRPLEDVGEYGVFAHDTAVVGR